MRDTAVGISEKIKHVVVLMLENRSFDHLCGYLREGNPDIRGVFGTEYNDLHPGGDEPGRVPISDDAPYVPDLNPGPGHDVRDVRTQLYAGGDGKTIANLGFVYDYSRQAGVSPTEAGRVMQCFAPSKLPVLTTLARAFALCDAWHSSLPGPTWPNRLFVHCATSGGFIDNAPREFPMPSIFERLSNLELDSWRIYFHDTPQTFMLTRLRNTRYFRFFEHVDAFFRDCREARLPRYSFIEPRYFSVLGAAANDQHPDHGILPGEHLIADVYNALRSSDQWLESLLVITWDEHGGFYDHVAPETTVNPDGKVSPEFDFKLLGVRVPAILVSPWISPGTVDHTPYDHSSIPATLKLIFGAQDFLTDRDAQSRTFEHNCSLPSPRNDARVIVTPAKPPLATAFHNTVQGAMSQLRPPNDLQRSLVALANEVAPAHARNPDSILTELQAAQHVHEATIRTLSV